MADPIATGATRSEPGAGRPFGGLPDAAAVLSFPDQALETAVRDQLAKPTGGITDVDMQRLTRLSSPGAGITDLTGLQLAVNLTELGLYGNRISDLGPLAGLSGLTDLTLSDNVDIVDVTPLAGLVSLRILDLSSNKITSVAGLAPLRELAFLDLSDNRVSDVAPLAGLTQAQDLVLFNNQITTITPLVGLTGLETLDLTYNLLDLADGSAPRATIAGLVAAGVDVTYDPQAPPSGAADATPPHTTSNRVAYYANSATILLTPTDNEGGSGVAHTHYALNGAAPLEGTTVNVPAVGSYSLSFWSEDIAGNLEPTHTVTFTVIAKPASNGTPSIPAPIATLRHGRSFTVYGYIIKHTAGTSPVTLQFYRYQSGHWVLKKSTAAKVSTILTFSKYADSTSVPLSGKWRVRARHKVGSHYHYSGYRTFSAS
jgi:hypothetical protein